MARRVILVLILGFSFFLSLAGKAWAAGKPRPQPESDPVIHQPAPLNRVVLLDVGTMPFHLPNGSTVELTADLRQLLETAVTLTPNFRAIVAGALTGNDPCQAHLKLKAAVTTLDLKVASVGVKFGYTPSGENSTVANLNGKVKVDVGLIGMDFSVWKCVGGSCETAIAAHQTHLTADAGLSFELDLGEVTTGGDLVWKSALNKIIRKIMDRGMRKIAESEFIARVPWHANVTWMDPAGGRIGFNAGFESNIGPKQSFGVYQEIGAQGACPVYRRIAFVHTSQADSGESTAVVEESLEGAAIRVGDEVRIRAASIR